MHVVRQMVDLGETGARKTPTLPSPACGGGFEWGCQRSEIDVVDRVLAVAVDEVDQAAADALDGRDVELHRPELAVHWLGAELDRAVIGRGGILDAERDGADR